MVTCLQLHISRLLPGVTTVSRLGAPFRSCRTAGTRWGSSTVCICSRRPFGTAILFHLLPPCPLFSSPESHWNGLMKLLSAYFVVIEFYPSTFVFFYYLDSVSGRQRNKHTCFKTTLNGKSKKNISSWMIQSSAGESRGEIDILIHCWGSVNWHKICREGSGII